MDAVDYADWCKYAGIYLGNVSHADRYRAYRRKLSPAGLVTRIVYDFLRDNAGGIDVQGWRCGSVYEAGTDATFRVEQTALALDAVGAPRLAEKVRTARDTSPLGKLFERPGDMNAIREFMAQHDPAKVMEQLRANIARAQRQMGVGSGLPAPEQKPTPPDADVESWERVEHLLGQYVVAHQAELLADVEKFGDARREPGFDPTKRLEELGRLYRRELDVDRQQQKADEMLKLTAQLEAQLAAQPRVKSGKIASPRRKFLECYRHYSRRPADELVPAMREWLRKAEQLQDRYPDVFRPRPATDERLQTRLAEIGPYETNEDGGRTTLSWDEPRGLECDWTTFRLVLEFPAKKDAVLSRLLDVCDRLRRRFGRVQADLRREVLEHFEMYRDWIGAQSLEWSERDASGRPTERAVLEKAGGGCIRIEAPEWAEDAATIDVFFGVEWYEEHGLEVSLIDEPDEA